MIKPKIGFSTKGEVKEGKEWRVEIYIYIYIFYSGGLKISSWGGETGGLDYPNPLTPFFFFLSLNPSPPPPTRHFPRHEKKKQSKKGVLELEIWG